MADRRTDDQPLAPRRPLTGSGQGKSAGTTTNESPRSTSTNQTSSKPTNNQPTTSTTPGKPTTSSANSSSPGKPVTGPAPSSSPSASPAPGKPVANETSRKPIADRVTERVSGAVTAATETMRKATEPRKAEERRPGRPGTPAATSRPGGSKPRTRKARLRMTHVDPWSVMKTAFLLSIAMGIVTVIAVAMVWSVLGAAGVWDSINQTVQEVIGGTDGSAFDVEDYVGASRVLGFTMIVAVVDVVLITAIATLGAFLYNLAATLLGGIEVTLTEEER